jgi:tRNA (guanosine-2'-O-)-methyltransferase
MNFEDKQKLLEYLFDFISENKRSKFEEIIHSRTRYLTVVLENIFQPHNASAVLRSCDCFGVQDVHIIENSNTYEVSKEVALGSSKWLNLIKYNTYEFNTLDAFKQLRLQGYRIVATSPHKKDQMLEDLPLDGKIALVFGTELEGLSPQAMADADEYVKIPMYGFTESFNISVSAALCLFNITERLKKTSINWQLKDEEKLDVMLNWIRQVIKKVDMIEDKFIKILNPQVGQ